MYEKMHNLGLENSEVLIRTIRMRPKVQYTTGYKMHSPPSHLDNVRGRYKQNKMHSHNTSQHPTHIQHYTYIHTLTHSHTISHIHKYIHGSTIPGVCNWSC